MKSLITTLSILTFATTTGSLSNILNITAQKNSISTNSIATKTEQNTIYIDKFGKEATTSKKNLVDLDIKEIVQIGFYQNEKGKIQAVKMPKTIEKLPNKLPAEITSTKDMFADAISFNQDISQWDTSNVTNMSRMFVDAEKFNQNLSSWNTKNVTNMSEMFGGTDEFNQDISQWNTAKVKAMSFMFCNAWKFNQNLSGWNVKEVTYYNNFSTNSGIVDSNKLPKFRK